MSDLITAEEFAQEWLAAGPPPELRPVVQSLVNRIGILQLEIKSLNEKNLRLGAEVATLRGNLQGRVDGGVQARLDEVTDSMESLRQAIEDVQIALGDRPY